MQYAKIYERKYDQDSRVALLDVMDREQLERADFYMQEYNTLKAETDTATSEWQEIEELYHGDRSDTDGKDDSYPKSFVNIILPQVEGQVAAMTEQNISANFKGVGVSDQSFARTANIIMRTVFKHNKIKQKVKRAGRRYVSFGNAAMVVGWDPDAFDGMGMPTIDTPFPGHILVDGKIKNMEDYQKADFIIRVIGYKSIIWARREYGDKLADAIMMGNNEPTFSSDNSGDDDHSFTLLHIWTRNNEYNNLQLVEMSLCGVILRESDPSKPYYEFVRNQYPVFFAGLYPLENQFWRFGDGKLLEPVQKLMNKLFDEIILAVRFAGQSRTFVDTGAQMNPKDFDGDPTHPIMCKNPNQNIKTESGRGINEVVFNLVNLLFQKVQEMTRFSALMMGNSPESGMTATQAGIQMQQGNSGINDKRTDISGMLEDAAPYCLGLCMQFWPAAVALRVSDNEDDFEWVDARQLASVPKMIPADSDYQKSFREMNPNSKERPKWMQLMVDGKPATKVVALDCDVSIGEGLPSNKMALYNIIMSLAQLSLPDPTTGSVRPLMEFEQVRTQVEDLLGIKIEDTTPKMMGPQVANRLGIPSQISGMPNVPNMPMGASIPPINQDANIPGANMAGQMKGGTR